MDTSVGTSTERTGFFVGTRCETSRRVSAGEIGGVASRSQKVRPPMGTESSVPIKRHSAQGEVPSRRDPAAQSEVGTSSSTSTAPTQEGQRQRADGPPLRTPARRADADRRAPDLIVLESCHSTSISTPIVSCSVES